MKLIALAGVLKNLGLKEAGDQIISLARKSDSSYLEFAKKIFGKLISGDREKYLPQSGENFFIGFRLVMDKEEIGDELLEKIFGFVPTKFFFEIYIVLDNPKKHEKVRWGFGDSEIIEFPKRRADGSISPGFFEIILIPTPEDVRTGNLSKFISSSLDTLLHEVTHVINSLRQGASSSFKGLPAKGKNQRITSSQDYADSREEIQARLIPIIDEIKSRVEEEASGNSDNSQFSKKLFESIIEKNPSKFVNLIFNNFEMELHLIEIKDENDEIIARKVSDESIKVYRKRLGDIYLELVQEYSNQ